MRVTYWRILNKGQMLSDINIKHLFALICGWIFATQGGIECCVLSCSYLIDLFIYLSSNHSVILPVILCVCPLIYLFMVSPGII